MVLYEKIYSRNSVSKKWKFAICSAKNKRTTSGVRMQARLGSSLVAARLALLHTSMTRLLTLGHGQLHPICCSPWGALFLMHMPSSMLRTFCAKAHGLSAKFYIDSVECAHQGCLVDCTLASGSALMLPCGLFAGQRSYSIS